MCCTRILCHIFGGVSSHNSKSVRNLSMFLKVVQIGFFCFYFFTQMLHITCLQVHSHMEPRIELTWKSRMGDGAVFCCSFLFGQDKCLLLYCCPLRVSELCGHVWKSLNSPFYGQHPGQTCQIKTGFWDGEHYSRTCSLSGCMCVLGATSFIFFCLSHWISWPILGLL